MADSSITRRSLSLHRFLSGQPDCGLLHRGSREALLDAFLLLYKEMSSDTSRKTVKEASSFTRKYDAVAEHLHSLCLSKRDFELVRTIGRGHFGEVHVVRDKHSSDVYAMKTLRKADMLAQENTAFFEEERDIMAKSHNTWITALHYGFQDHEFLYLVMDYHPGGDLLTLLSKHDDIFEEKMAQFYLSEMVEAIDSLHSFGYVHRDIKPDNVLISSSGHIKLADFGSSARLSPGSRTVVSKMPVGTPDYIAPEVLACINGSGGSYGVKCDWWSLGICAYEMMFGQTPFTDNSVAITYKNITSHKSSLTFPDDCDDVSDSARDLIRHLLCDECNRLDSDPIHSHAFFAGVNFDTLLSSTPPYVPTIRSIDDTSNFEELEAKAPDPGHLIRQSMRKEANKGFSGKDLPFIGFTYTRSLSDLESEKAKENNGYDTSVKDTQTDGQEEEHDLQTQVAVLQRDVDEKGRLLEETRRDKNTVEMEKALFEADMKELTRRLNREQTEWSKTDEKALKLVDDVRQQNKQLMELRDDEAKAALEEQKQIAMQLETDLETSVKQCCIVQAELTTSQQMQEKTKNKAAQLYAKYKKLKEESRKNARKVESELLEVKQAKQESDARVLQLQTKVSSLKSDLSATLERLSLTGKSKSKLEEHLNLFQISEITKDETEKCSEAMQECSDGLQVKLTEEQTTGDTLRTKVRELEEQEADQDRELEKMRTTSNFQIKRYKEKLSLVETAQRSAEEQLQTLRGQAEVKAEMCKTDSKMKTLIQKTDKLESQLAAKTQECSDLWEANKALTAALVEQEKEGGNLQDTNDDLKAVLNSRKLQLEAHEETIKMLKEKCSSLGTQVEELEVAVDECDENEEKLIKSNESLKSQVESLEQQLAASKQQHSYEKAARQRADERVSKASDLLKEAEEAHGEEVSGLQEKTAQLRAEVETLSGQLREAERARALSEVNVKSLEDRLEATDKEHQQLRRDISKSNREIGFAKATSLKLNRELGLLRQELESVTKERDDLASQLSALSVSHSDEKIRMQTTQAQQAKLISLLQSDNTATKTSWKKKMARTPCKVVIKRSRDPCAQTEDWKQLQEAVWQDELRKTEQTPPSITTSSPPPENTDGKNATNCTSVEMMESGKVNLSVSSLALTALQESPGNQPSPRVALPSTPSDFAEAGNCDLKSKPGTRMRERMHHNIPHRFATTRAMKSTKCASCHSTVHFGKVAKCSHCKVICHLKCAPSLPATCGLPSALVDHYVTESMKPAVSSPVVTSASVSTGSHDKMQGWIKLLRYSGTKRAWEQQWAVLSDMSLMLYNKEKPQISECDADEVLHLSNATLQPSVSCLDLPDVAKTDIPFIFSVALPQPTRCWPTQTIYCLSDSKQLWIQSLQHILKTVTVDKSSLKSLVSLENSVALDVNCCLYLNEKVLLLGAGEGLFVLHMSSLPKSGHITRKTIQSSRVLQQIPGVGNVQQMERIPESDFIVLITGGDGELVSVNETDVRSLAYSAGSPPPDMSFSKILDIISCSIFCSGNVDGEVYLCAAVSGKVRLLKSRPDSRGFRLIKDFSCGKEVVGSLSFTGSVFIVTTNKFFTLCPKTLHIEDFATKVLSTTLSDSNFPIAALAVSGVSPSKDHLEILLCSSESGVFVNQHGEKTRSGVIAWSRMPQAFAYRAPYLMITYLHSAEIINLNEQSLNKCAPLSIEVARPRLLSPSTVTPNSHIFIALMLSDQTDILEYDPSTEETNDRISQSSDKVVSPKRPRPPSCFSPLAEVNRPKPNPQVSKLKQIAGSACRLFSPMSASLQSENLSVSISDVLSDSLMSAANDTPSPKRFREAHTDT